MTLPEPTPRIKKLWRVDIEHRAETYVLVLADTEQEARVDAEEMNARDMFLDYEADYYAREVPDTFQLHDSEEIWTGGPDGQDITVKQYRENQYRENPPPSAESTKPPPEIPGQLSLTNNG